MKKLEKKNSLMFCHMGNGISVCDRCREEYGDYMKVAHISYERQVTYRNSVSDSDRAKIEEFAKSDNMTQSATQPYPVLKPI